MGAAWEMHATCESAFYCASKQEATESSNELNAVPSTAYRVHFKRVA